MEQEAALISEYFTLCPLCGGRIEMSYGGVRDRFEVAQGYFNIFTCTDCGIRFTNPLPKHNLELLYPEFYLSSTPSGLQKSFLSNLERRYRENQYRFDFSLFRKATGLKVKDIKSYLDIGCGTGDRVNYAKSKGCDTVFGIDSFDFFNVPMDKQKHFLATEILEFKPPEKYHVVSLFHVLEHLPDPFEVIKHIAADILQAQGYLIIQVPNYDSYERVIFKGRWSCFDVPRHLWHFTPSFLSKSFGQNGWEVIGQYPRNAFLHPVSFAPSLHTDLDIQRIWVHPGGKHGKMYWSIMKTLWVAFTLFSIPISAFLTLLNKASMLTVVLKKA